MRQRLIRVCGSIPEVGSSRKSTCGSCTSARATISRCARPPESWKTIEPARSVSENCSSSSSARALARARDTPKKRPW